MAGLAATDAATRFRALGATRAAAWVREWSDCRWAGLCAGADCRAAWRVRAPNETPNKNRHPKAHAGAKRILERCQKLSSPALMARPSAGKPGPSSVKRRGRKSKRSSRNLRPLQRMKNGAGRDGQRAKRGTAVGVTRPLPSAAPAIDPHRAAGYDHPIGKLTEGGETVSTGVRVVRRHVGLHLSVIEWKTKTANPQLALAA